MFLFAERIRLHITADQIKAVREIGPRYGALPKPFHRRFAWKPLEQVAVPLHPHLTLSAIETSAAALASHARAILSSVYPRSNSTATQPAPRSALSRILAQNAKPRIIPVVATIANPLNRFVLLEESPALRDDEVWHAYAEDRLAQKYGPAKEPWKIALTPRDGALSRLLDEAATHVRRREHTPGAARFRLASAVPAAFITALVQACEASSVALESVRPALVQALDVHSSALSRREDVPLWLVLLTGMTGTRAEPPTTLQATAIRFVGSRPVHFAQRLVALEGATNAAQALLRWLKREQLVLGVPSEAEAVQFGWDDRVLEAPKRSTTDVDGAPDLSDVLAHWLSQSELLGAAAGS